MFQLGQLPTCELSFGLSVLCQTQTHAPRNADVDVARKWIPRRSRTRLQRKGGMKLTGALKEKAAVWRTSERQRGGQKRHQHIVAELGKFRVIKHFKKACFDIHPKNLHLMFTKHTSYILYHSVNKHLLDQAQNHHQSLTFKFGRDSERLFFGQMADTKGLNLDYYLFLDCQVQPGRPSCCSILECTITLDVSGWRARKADVN